MENFLQLGRRMPGMMGGQTDGPTMDTAEQVYISSLALLKMLKHGRAGVPMEVMGLMLGEEFRELQLPYTKISQFNYLIVVKS